MVVWCSRCGKRRACYKEEGKNKPLLYCGNCKTDGLIKADGRICSEEGCSIGATFGDSDKIMFCKNHALVGMIDIKSKRCKYKNCKIVPVFGFKGGSAEWCKKHAQPGMVNVYSKNCEYPGCQTTPSFNYKGEKVKRFCKKHAEIGMINLMSKTCEYEGCLTRPSFNKKGELKGKFCKKHAQKDMVCVTVKTCEHQGCELSPNFNYPKTKKGRFCSTHRLDGMIDVKHRSCAYEGCQKQPGYNYKGLPRKFCKLHALENMICIGIKYCEYENCLKQAMFNVPNVKNGKFCKEHSLEGMVDVKNKMCLYPGCTIRASQGLLFTTPTRCSKHKTPNMVPIKNIHPKCQHSFPAKCSNKPFFAAPSTTFPTHCETHAPEGYINIVEKPCPSCGLSFFIPDDQKMCQDCRDFSNPVIRHSKELRIKAILEANNIPITTHDKIPHYACSKKRPDFTIDCNYFFLILEVDENQHQSYACDCEVSRMIQLHQDFGGTPIIFIRYNPDSYTDYLGQTHKGFNQNPKRERRLIELIQKIRRKTEVPGDPSVYYLYYDGDDEKDKLFIMNYTDFNVQEIIEDMETEKTKTRNEEIQIELLSSEDE